MQPLVRPERRPGMARTLDEQAENAPEARSYGLGPARGRAFVRHGVPHPSRPLRAPRTEPYLSNDHETQAFALSLRDFRVPGPSSRTGGRGCDGVCLADGGHGNGIDGGLCAARARHCGLSEILPGHGGLPGQDLPGESSRPFSRVCSSDRQRRDHSGRRRISRPLGQRPTRTAPARLSLSPAFGRSSPRGATPMQCVRVQMMNSGAVK